MMEETETVVSENKENLVDKTFNSTINVITYIKNFLSANMKITNIKISELEKLNRNGRRKTAKYKQSLEELNGKIASDIEIIDKKLTDVQNYRDKISTLTNAEINKEKIEEINEYLSKIITDIKNIFGKLSADAEIVLENKDLPT